jgi:hypothetical protein
MDNQHLGLNPSRWFPPSVSQGSEMGPCDQEGGSERRVCVRVRTGRGESCFLWPRRLSQGETALKGSLRLEKEGLGAERRCLRRRVYKTGVLLHSLRCQVLQRLSLRSPNARAKYLDSWVMEGRQLLQALCPQGICRSPVRPSLSPRSPPFRTKAAKLSLLQPCRNATLQPTWLGWDCLYVTR